MDTIEKISSGLFNSLGFKLGLIGVLVLLLLIPANMIMELIREREQRRADTILEVTSVWGNEQTLCGPVLTVPFKSAGENEQSEFQSIIKYAHFLPENLVITGTVEPEIRYRGIYKVVTYHAKLHFKGNFPVIDPTALNIDRTDIESENAWVEIGIPDMRGINRNILFTWGDSVQTIIPGIPVAEITGSGVHCNIQLTFSAPHDFAFDIDLNGSNSLKFIPLGKETNVTLSSSWPTPGFGGSFLPDKREINKDGFNADWNVLQLNRNYPQQWINEQYSVEESAFGVDLITPAGNYQKSIRSAKYAILFIGLTFLIFFFSEVFTRVRIHAVNYFLVGIALCVFYSLLTALAEHMAFSLAYLIGSITVILLISVFAHSLYKQWKVTVTLISALVILYIFLFVILQLTDYSLLFGNIGLILIIGLVMYFSRKIDWYTQRTFMNTP